MSILTDWVTNIIVFILFAIILDMLLPSSTMQKYTKLVIGLLLIAVFIAPILSIFNENFTSNIQEKIMQSSTWKNPKLENSMESKKREIEETQQAYILEHMAVQLKNEAEKELMDQSNYAIQDITITLLDKNGEMNVENIETIHVFVAESQESSSEIVQPVEKIDINIDEKQTNMNDVPSSELSTILSNIWGIDSNKIVIGLNEGGDGL